ncbi:MAG: ABC transporter permease [Spirochaeta sp.]|jgi:lipoprotein-releasing system permease protein|nr:ABC transporter permease [Spirochaeta sp.]
MNSWVFFVARRLLGSRHSRRGGAGGLAILGITAGVATLVVVLAVMNGFQLGTIENLLELNSFHLRLETDITVDTYTPENPIGRSLQNAATSETTAIVPFTEIQTLARGYWPEPQGIMIRGVPPDWLERDRGAAEQLEVPVGAFDLSDPTGIVLGTELSRALGVRVGDTVAVTHIPAGGSRPAEVQLTVTGLFRSGYLEFDRSWGFVSLASAADVLDARDPVIYGIKVSDRFDVEDIAEQLRDTIPEVTVATWREFNRGIFGALRMEKSMMVFLVGLIFLVVAGNIYQLLRRSILERSEEIAILRAIGAGAQQIRFAFILEGWFIGTIGTLTGMLIGLFLSGNLNEIFQLLEWVTGLLGDQGVQVFSPSYFYIEEIPRRISPQELLAIASGAVGIAVVAARFAANSVVRIQPQELLRNE